MIICKTINSLDAALNKIRQQNHSVGFVPTMGALHEGHISLIKACIKNGDFTVASIFVNPTQFNNANDLAKYPKTIERDIEMLATAGCDLLFLPAVNEIYPEGPKSSAYQLGRIETLLEGAFRPGHYQGVATVVDRLLLQVKPQRIYLGQKDYQQCMIINKMIELKKHNTEVVVCPTQREENGLAMSSRNIRLTTEQRENARIISRELYAIKDNLYANPVFELQSNAQKNLQDHGFVVDYVSIADAKTLEPAEDIDKDKKLVALIAASLGDIRLIDNMTLN